MKILLAVDGSDDSRKALEFAARLPFPQPPSVLLAHVAPVPSLDDVTEEIASQSHPLVEECRKKGTAMLAEAQASCVGWAAQVETKLLAGNAGRELVRLARDASVDLIVAGARGSSLVTRFLTGSVADALARHAHCSVLIVRNAPAGQKPLRVMIADDGSAEGGRAIGRLAAMKLPTGSEVLLMQVVDTVQAYHTEYTLQGGPALTNLLAKSQQRLEASAAKLKSSADTVSVLIEEGVNAADRLLKKAAQWKPDLIVVGSQGKSGWEHALLGSVSTRILNYAECSVWIERPAG